MKNQLDNNYNSTIIKNSVRNISIIFIRYYQLEKKVFMHLAHMYYKLYS